MKKYIRASELSGEQLADYINKVKRNVEIDLEDAVEEINWDMDEEKVKVLVEFLDDNRAAFFFEIWRFAMNPYYIASDADIITNTIRNYMKKHRIPSRDDSISDWEELKRKSVMDSDGFWTDYTLYVNGDQDHYICIFGDKDYYTPENADPDFECETYEEAIEWFEDYNGFEDESDDSWMEEIESSIDLSFDELETKLHSDHRVQMQSGSFPVDNIVIENSNEYLSYPALKGFAHDDSGSYDYDYLKASDIKDVDLSPYMSKGIDILDLDKLIEDHPEIFYESVHSSCGVESSTSLADKFGDIHDRDEINWQMQDYNYDPFYEELKVYMKPGETWDDKDDDGYPVDTNISPKELFSRMPEDKQKDFMKRFWIHNPEVIESSTSAKRMNATEVVRWMYNNYPDWAFYDEHELADGRIQLKFESGPKNQKTDLEEDLEELGIHPVFRNGLHIIVSEDPEYVIESSEEFFDKDEDAVYWYRTTHGVQPGSVPKGLEILQVIDRADGTYFSTNRVITTDALKYYDIKEKSPYIKSSQSAKKFVGRTYSDLIQDIENKSKYTVDSAYLRRRKADNWIRLYDEKGQSYSTEITEYSDGSFELMEYNITKDVE